MLLFKKLKNLAVLSLPHAGSFVSGTFYPAGDFSFGNGTLQLHLSGTDNVLFAAYSRWDSFDSGHVEAKTLTWEDGKLTPTRAYTSSIYIDRVPWHPIVSWDPYVEEQRQGTISWILTSFSNTYKNVTMVIANIGENLVPTKKTAVDFPMPEADPTRPSSEKQQSARTTSSSGRKIQQLLRAKQERSSSSTFAYPPVPPDIAISENKISAVVSLQTVGKVAHEASEQWHVSCDKALEACSRKRLSHSNEGDETSYSETKHFTLPDGSTVFLSFRNTDKISSTAKSELIYKREKDGKTIAEKTVLTLEEPNVSIGIERVLAEYDEASEEISIKAINYHDWSHQLYEMRIGIDGTVRQTPELLSLPDAELFEIYDKEVPESIHPDTGLVSGDHVALYNMEDDTTNEEAFLAMRTEDPHFEPKGEMQNITHGDCQLILGGGNSVYVNNKGTTFFGVHAFCEPYAFYNLTVAAMILVFNMVESTPTTGQSNASTESSASSLTTSQILLLTLGVIAVLASITAGSYYFIKKGRGQSESRIEDASALEMEDQGEADDTEAPLLPRHGT